MRSIGVDIGSYSVKVCVVSATKKGVFLDRFAEHIYKSINPFDRDIEIIEFLRATLANENPLQTVFVGSLPQDLVSIHTKVFPFKDRLKIFRSLPFELEEETPFNPDETIFDGRIVRYESAQAEVLACACPKETIKKYLQLLSDSGIKAQLLTPEGIAFANHFERWFEAIPVVPSIDRVDQPSELPIPPRRCQAVLNIGHSKTIVVVLEDNKLVDIRTLYWGGANIAKAIQEKYNLSPTEALKQLQGNSFILTTQDGATPDQIFFSNLIAGCVNELIRDLRLVLMEIQASNNAQIEMVYMTGGVSRLQNLGPFITQGIELPVNKFSVLNHYPNTFFDKTPWNDAVSGTAIGLAIEGLRKPRNPATSLLRGEFAVQSHALKNFIEAWGATLKVAATAVVILYIYAYIRESMAISMVEEVDNQMVTQAGELARLKGSKASEAGIERFIREKRNNLNELKKLQAYSGMNSALEILQKINDTTPGRATLRMEVRKLVIRDSQVHMEGYVGSMKDAEALKLALQNVAKESKITSVPSQIAFPPGKIGFGYEFKVDRNVKLAKEPHNTGSKTE